MLHSTLRKRATRNPSRRPSLELQPGPRNSTINAILNYSKALTVVEAPPLGKIAVVLN
jgi:hypothetical protein